MSLTGFNKSLFGNSWNYYKLHLVYSLQWKSEQTTKQHITGNNDKQNDDLYRTLNKNMRVSNHKNFTLNNIS